MVIKVTSALFGVCFLRGTFIASPLWMLVFEFCGFRCHAHDSTKRCGAGNEKRMKKKVGKTRPLGWFPGIRILGANLLVYSPEVNMRSTIRRCISYWNWEFPNVMLVFRGVPVTSLKQIPERDYQFETDAWSFLSVFFSLLVTPFITPPTQWLYMVTWPRIFFEKYMSCLDTLMSIYLTMWHGRS